MNLNQEAARVQKARGTNAPWKKWGPYLSQRQWGTLPEDGLAGISDDKQLLCFALALRNVKDSTSGESNPGEDAFYLDSTPTHSYMKYLYKYPQRAFPYTGLFEDNRYFDVFVEYAKSTPEDILIQISICNRGPGAASIHVVPTLWFRNPWSWSDVPKPVLQQVAERQGVQVVAARSILGDRFLYCDGEVPLQFTGNGTKASAHYEFAVNAGQTMTIWLRLSDWPPENLDEPFGKKFSETIRVRRSEADEFYRAAAVKSWNI